MMMTQVGTLIKINKTLTKNHLQEWFLFFIFVLNLKPNVMTAEIHPTLQRLAFFQIFVKEEGHTELQIAMAKEAIHQILIICKT